MSEEFVAKVNAMPGWVKEMGIVILTATPEEVSCEWEVSEKHLQGYGIVHGGVHCGVIETLASVGAAAVAHPRGQRVVGLENSTSFIRAVRSGKLHALAMPVRAGARARCGRCGYATKQSNWWRKGACACSAWTRIARSAERPKSGQRCCTKRSFQNLRITCASSIGLGATSV